MSLETSKLISGFKGFWEDFVSENKTREIKDMQDKDALEDFSKEFKLLFSEFIKKTGSTNIRDFLKLTFKPTTHEELSWDRRLVCHRYYSYGDIIIEFTALIDKLVVVNRGSTVLLVDLKEMLED